MILLDVAPRLMCIVYKDHLRGGFYAVLDAGMEDTKNY